MSIAFGLHYFLSSLFRNFCYAFGLVLLYRLFFSALLLFIAECCFLLREFCQFAEFNGVRAWKISGNWNS